MKNYFSMSLMTFCLAGLLSSCGTTLREYSVTSGSENLQSLTKITDNADQPVWSVATSPDGNTIFLALYNGGPVHLYKKDNPLSPSMAQITSGDIRCNTPVYNPATNKVAFSYRTRYDAYNWAKGDIFMLGLQNVNALTPVTQTATLEEYNPSFSPDGEIVCYQSKGGNAGEIWIKNLKTNENTLLGKGMQPILSPDGKKIAFSRYKTSADNSPCNIWIMNVDGSDVTQVTTSAEERAFQPCWSPDGKRIIFQATKIKTKNPNTDLFVINADGSGLMQLTTNESNDNSPKWSSDGYIYFISDRGAKEGNNQLWRFKMY